MSSSTVSRPGPVVLHHHGAGARAVVFVHGFLDDALIWENLIGALSAEGFEFVSLDLAGCGQRAGADGPFDYERFAADVTEVLDLLGKPCVLVGHSMGGPVAELVAAARPEQCLGVVLVTPIPLAGAGLPGPAVEPFRALAEQGPEANRAVRRQLAPAFPDPELDRICVVDEGVRAEVVRALVTCWNDGHDLPGEPFAGPVLVVRGARDGFVTDELAAAAAARYPQARSAVLGNAGHWPHVEDPGAVAARLDSFLATLQPVPAAGWTQAFADKSAESFAQAFAEGVVLEASVLARPVRGRDAVKKVMGTASGIYESLEFTEQSHEDNRSYLEWRAVAFGGTEFAGVTVLTRDDGGEIVHAAIHHRPLGAALRFSLELRDRLTGEIPSDHFYDRTTP
ncbi:alpha/beta fold hydrolase [Amycolatopsis sp. A133]|uniref:alpha/beta fold hydrolase n=1 Tax=Amycolatopsis sp. A133 TaxID=3064472 RepID=UPI0027F9440A|nr:alpha/beta fold hydrolase [Amycolatopsis sp. A133]MDQ7809017.1 alpha/beta fold hydrolase [Amycolatopsis sp. A133]